ncbi:NUDIX domain-containing protein [Elioraea sp.]|uniref:NUDIX domain-containing protein n=1 Tax=Elioraea sp. TaxID=2185103 RepID=UPI003F6F3F54
MTRRFASALLLDQHGRYLMQVRDDIPGILHPGAFGLFGGAVEPGEGAEVAVRRELDEEIGFVPGDLAPWRALWVPVRVDGAALCSGRVDVFTGTVPAELVPDLDQREGAGRVLVSPRLLLLEAKVATSARLAVGLHAQAAMAAAGEEEPVMEWWPARLGVRG